MFYDIWLQQIPKMYNKEKIKMRKVRSARELFYIEENEWLKLGGTKSAFIFIKAAQKEAALAQAKKIQQRMEEKNIQFISYFHPCYPKKLKLISSPPYGLYMRGNPQVLDGRAIAIVGSRKGSSYGLRQARRFGRKLAQNGICIVSGLAYGIDSAAQKGAVEEHGKVCAVLGCGLDICYPKENFPLYWKILETNGLLISEYPPGTKPFPSFFPARNRIISGISDAVLVMEAAKRSGSFITADQALEQGKEVYALPGSIENQYSQGCHRLIQQGAGVLISPEDLLFEVYQIMHFTEKIEKSEKLVLESKENMVYSCLRLDPRNIEEIQNASNLPPSEVMEAIISLKMKGLVEESSRNYYRKRENMPN